MRIPSHPSAHSATMESLAMKLFAFLMVVLLLCEHCDCIVPRDSLIKMYFHRGYAYRAILCFLFFIHGISLSLRQLKRILKKLNLRRRPRRDRTYYSRLRRLVRTELKGRGSLLGYRALWKRICTKYKTPASRDSIMRILRQEDPIGVATRKQHKLVRRTYRNKGPNYVWHIDGFDKLKPYGFAVHGCIDGFSRRVLWVKVSTTNNNPRVVAWYFLQCVRQLKGTARILRSDCGTENTNMAFMQPFLRRSGEDCFADFDSFRYGKSVSNQRIESWWSQLQKSCTRWWVNLFKELQYVGLFDETNTIHVDCLRFCFMHIIQKDLDSTAAEWNSHRIRRSAAAVSPGGVPDELFFLPEVHGTRQYLCPVSRADLRIVTEYTEMPDAPASLEFLEMAQELMEEHNLSFAQNCEEALLLYVDLVSLIEDLL